jgi:hypothetical protein
MRVGAGGELGFEAFVSFAVVESGYMLGRLRYEADPQTSET